MDAERWAVVKEIFAAVERLPASERSDYLDEKCRGDDSLRAEVESLLASLEDADDFLESATPLFDTDAVARQFATKTVGKRIGAYRVLECIGQGGMGAVYRAERADGAFAAQVAIKFIREGFESDNAIRRFEIERDALAQLNHPGVARLLDGGATKEGLPYLVMEYVEGEPIDAYCDRRKLATPARLELFRKVCEAVAAAHRQLIVHRDLKPGNILVTSDGRAKLLDFGIAKLLGGQGAAAASATRESERVMTPLFASPEQMRGKAVTTTSDVYSLGMLLYVLLTGRYPHDVSGLTSSEMERVLCEDDPLKPSTVVAHRMPTGTQDGAEALDAKELATRHGTSPLALKKTLTGDLDRIVMMAIRKEPERRYASVDQLNDDIQRYLDGRPVSATRPSWAYVTAKFLRRHQFGAAAGIVLALAIVGGVAGTTWEAFRAHRQERIAEQRFDDVRQLANSFLFEFDESIRDLPGSTKARHLVVERALEYLQRLSLQSADDRSLQQEIATAYIRVGNIQGNPYFANLGDPQGALRSYRQALRIYGELFTADRRDDDAMAGEALAHRRVADMLAATGDMAGAIASYWRAATLYDSLIDRRPNDDSVAHARAGNQTALAELLAYNGDTSTAETLLGEARGTLEQLTNNAPPAEPAWRDLALCLQKQGVVASALGQSEQALGLQQEALDIAKRIAADRPAGARAQRDVAFGYFRVAGLLASSGSTERAIEQLTSAMKIVRDLASADPENAQARRDVSVILVALGDAVWETGDYVQCRTHYAEALEVRRRLLRETPDNTQALRDVALCFERVGDAEGALNHTQESIEGFQRALDIRNKLLKRDPNDWNVRRSITYALTSIGEQHLKAAADASRTASEREENRAAALAALNKCRSAWQAIYEHAKTPANQQVELGQIEKLIAQCGHGESK